MQRLTLSLAAVLALASPIALTGPAAAQSLSVLLPVISFPDTVVTPATKGCGAPSTPAPVCQLQE